MREHRDEPLSVASCPRQPAKASSRRLVEEERVVHDARTVGEPEATELADDARLEPRVGHRARVPVDRDLGDRALRVDLEANDELDEDDGLASTSPGGSCTPTTAARCKARRCSPPCSGSASSRRPAVLASPTTIRTSRRCSAPRSNCPRFPLRRFFSFEDAQAWVGEFVAWYNDEHQHSGIGYVAPSDRHDGRDVANLALAVRPTLGPASAIPSAGLAQRGPGRARRSSR